MEDFGALLRRRRGAAGLTQEDLAERSGLSVRAIRTLERGERRRPRAGTVDYLARALGLSEPERAQFEEAAGGGPTAAPDSSALPPGDDVVVEPPTPLIGRGNLIAGVVDLLRGPGARLISLTGPGGVGKTRVGLRVADELRPECADGIVFVNLAGITDPTLFAPTVARALGLRDAGSRPASERLLEHLRAKEMLLLVDNFEQVKAAAPILVRLLAGSPRLKALATSRSALRVRGEQEVAVPSLEAPESGMGASAANTGRFPAVELFVERARALDLSFGLTDENVLAIAEICRRLDGLPLAIELAAARTKVLLPNALLARLDHSLALLTGGGLDLPKRQRTMRRTVSWSHELLSEGERVLFRRLAVFSGGFVLEAAEDICSPIAPPGTSEGPDVLDGLSSLVDASLLWRRDPSPGGEVRAGMLETVREYAVERLEASGEAARIRARHATFYANLAETAKPHHLGGPNHKSWLTRLERENGNLTAALRWSSETDTETGLRLVEALRAFWWMSGRLGEGRRWTEEFLSLAADDVRLARGTAQARATHGAGQLAYGQGDLARAASLFEEALSLGRRLGDEELAARTLAELGQVTRARGDLDRALALSEEGLTLSRRLGDLGHAAIALNTLGQIARRRGDLAGAVARHEEALVIFENLGDERGEAYTLGNLGIATLGHGDTGRSLALNQESLGLYERLGDKTGRAFASANLGDVSHQQGDEKRASFLYEQALTLYRELENERGEDRVRKRLNGGEDAELGLLYGISSTSSYEDRQDG